MRPHRAAVVVPPSWDPAPRVIGHRGSPREATENTLASFEAAARVVGAVELDARLSADDVVVVHHDAELGRVLEGEGAIESLASDTLRARGVPLLSEVLALPLAVDLELKADAANAGALPRLALEAVRHAGAQERVLASSFDWELADAYARLSGQPAGAIAPFAPSVDELESFPRLRFVMLSEDAALPEVVETLRAAGRRVLAWTVNDTASAMRLLASGVEGIITDRPGALAKALAQDSDG